MPSNPPASSVPPITPASPPPAAKRHGCLFYGCGVLIALALVIVATVLITLWWVQRPIRPVVLSPPEKAVVEQKLRQLGGGNAPAAVPPSPGAIPSAVKREAEAAETPAVPPVPAAGTDASLKRDRPYVPGSRTLKLTEREINGLLHANTDLGRSVRLEFARDAVQAYLAVRIPQDFPIGGGQMFRARGRFLLSLGNGGEPYAVLEDLTVLGLSLPKAWLGGLKGQNLIGRAMGERDGSPVFNGIKSLRVEPGTLVLEVEE